MVNRFNSSEEIVQMSYSSSLAGMEMVELVSAQDKNLNSGFAVIGTARNNPNIPWDG
jgi:hypothetical protein